MEITVPIKAKIKFNCDNFKKADKIFTNKVVANLIVKTSKKPMWIIYLLCGLQFFLISAKELIGGNKEELKEY
jgi:hypothetical protein